MLMNTVILRDFAAVELAFVTHHTVAGLFATLPVPNASLASLEQRQLFKKKNNCRGY